MRHRKNREIQIFSTSTLDLFCSGMGVFILLTVMMMPYYLNISKIPEAEYEKTRSEKDKLLGEKERWIREQKDLKGRVETAEESASALRRKLSQMQEDSDRIQGRLQDAIRNSQSMQDKLAKEKLKQSTQNDKETIAGLQKQLDESIRIITELQKQLMEAKAHISSMQKRLDESGQSAGSIGSELAKAKASIQKLQSQNLKMGLVEELSNQNEVLKRQLAQSESRMEHSVKFALLGLTSRANSFLLLVDMSGSLKRFSGAMRRTIEQIVDPMGAANPVQVVGFQEHRGPRFYSWMSEGSTKIMDNKAKKDLLAFVDKNLLGNLQGDTPTFKALQVALEYPVESIILLTDGAPTDASSDRIITEITKINSGRKEIHCVAIGYYTDNPNLTGFLWELARKNRGGFVGVAN